jgi:lipoate-protein ligase A
LSGAWRVEHRRGAAADLHDRPLGPAVERAVVVLEPARPALVLGSTQPALDADGPALRERGVDLARRRSGGGAVLLVPGESLWVDVELPRDDELWDDDVGRAFHWLGRAWADALASLDVHGDAHTGRLIESRWSRLVCFAGLGPGEVLVAGRKVVGVSQRRTRAGARFQCVVHRRWDARPLLELLAMTDDDRRDAAHDLAEVADGLDVDAEIVVDALLRVLQPDRATA